jgi:hypothetical protein
MKFACMLVLSTAFSFATTSIHAEDSMDVTGKTYVTSDHDMIKFFDNGMAVELNGNRGMIYPKQAIYFGEDGRSPRTVCKFKREQNTVALDCSGTKAVFTVNPDGSLSGPTDGIWGHKSFATMTEQK